MRTVELDWSGAVVEDGTLTLPFDAKAPKRWVREVTSVLERLDPDGSAEVGREALTIAVTVGEDDADVPLLRA
jgi:hypothetical protein